jgi:hypothetical protein
MNAQLDLPEEFTLPASAGEQDKTLRFRRDYGLGGVTHRARIGPLIWTVVLASPTAPAKSLSQVSSASPMMGDSEEEMSLLSKTDPTNLRSELIRRTLPFSLFVILALAAFNLDSFSAIWRIIFIAVGFILIGFTFYLWFPRDQESSGETDLPKQKL